MVFLSHKSVADHQYLLSLVTNMSLSILFLLQVSDNHCSWNEMNRSLFHLLKRLGCNALAEVKDLCRH